MRVDPEKKVVELTRTNLESLLAKLDGSPPNSACTIGGNEWLHGWKVRAVEDAEHYADRARGEMHPDTESTLSDWRAFARDVAASAAGDLEARNRLYVRAGLKPVPLADRCPDCGWLTANHGEGTGACSTPPEDLVPCKFSWATESAWSKGEVTCTKTGKHDVHEGVFDGDVHRRARA